MNTVIAGASVGQKLPAAMRAHLPPSRGQNGSKFMKFNVPQAIAKIRRTFDVSVSDPKLIE